MFLVVDANVLFSLFISKGRVFSLLKVNRLLKLFKLIVPDFFFEELQEHKSEILSKSRLTPAELEEVLNLFFSEVKVIARENFKDFETKAKLISPPDDFPYVALSLKVKSLGFEVAIWSEDKELKRMLEGKVLVLSTKELWRLVFK